MDYKIQSLMPSQIRNWLYGKPSLGWFLRWFGILCENRRHFREKTNSSFEYFCKHTIVDWLPVVCSKFDSFVSLYFYFRCDCWPQVFLIFCVGIRIDSKRTLDFLFDASNANRFNLHDKSWPIFLFR